MQVEAFEVDPEQVAGVAGDQGAGGLAPLSASIDLRRAATWFWSRLLDRWWGSSPQTASISSSVETTWLMEQQLGQCSIRCLMLPSRSGRSR